MRCRLPYGDRHLDLDLPGGGRTRVIRARRAAPLPDPGASVREALRSPVGSARIPELARGRANAVVVIDDVTRPVPHRLILPPILEEIREGGIPDDAVEILVATGTHRPNTPEEMEGMVGPAILGRYRWRNHDAREGAHVPIGEVSPGVAVSIDEGYVRAEMKVLTGLIQPHLLAGYSGGRKAVVPGLANLDALRSLHGYAMVSSDRTAYGVLDGNPFHEAALRGARLAGTDFIVNVSLDAERRPTGIFAGDLDAAHRAGCAFVARQVTVPPGDPTDVGIASGGGEPMDATLYQSIKGLVALEPFVRPGGTMLLLARCREGPGPAEFARLLLAASHPGALLREMARPGFFRKDQWMVQELCDLGRTWRLHCISDGLDRGDLPPWLHGHENAEEAIREIIGDATKVAVIPDGPRNTPIAGAPRRTVAAPDGGP